MIGGVTTAASGLRAWFSPPRPPDPEPVTDRRERRLIGLEIAVVLTVTLGLSGLRSALSLVEALLAPAPLADQQVTLNAPASTDAWIDLAFQLVRALQLAGWGALAAYLLLRAGFALRRVGLDGRRPGRDALHSAGLAALIGIPGLGLYLVGRLAGITPDVAPSTLTDVWWRIPMLVLSAAANSWAEEVVMIGYLLTRFRQLGFSENRSALLAGVLRGAYHLYQGVGAFVGNLVMGLVFARYWQRTNRLWPLVGAHLLIDIVAFVGYALLVDVLPF
ncbi:CPBP family intramembrane glutamic endopeptidase [Pseudonocardia sp. HH130630-07]|uniref:CPBP family intramembrane glutamic endopeptidase n=1 Tax=Pseudonocardia sp. HH130630-07 TaxID=1690815 RepID=UPI0008152E9A|nr:CPBP family intramembrane glutamic endopeptidase [Pseudonocardia sp. HH130630-07]ANY06684.1 CAAX protease [Pseudonocardia sp. HH130630-07]